MRIKYDMSSNDRALESIVKIVEHFCGEEDVQYSDADRLQSALRRLRDFTIYIDYLIESQYDQYEERLISAIERIADALEVDLHGGGD